MELKEVIGAPESARPLVLQTVGYPAEHWESGGQRPRLPFGQRFKLNHCDNEFPRDEKIVAKFVGRIRPKGVIRHSAQGR